MTSYPASNPDPYIYDVPTHDEMDELYGDPCDHLDYEVDIIDGRCWCDACGHRWYARNEQVEAEIERQRQYDEWERGENRRQWWRDLWDRIRSFLPRRRQPQFVSDDDIPF